MINTERGWRGGENQLLLLIQHLSPGYETQTVCQEHENLAQRLQAIGAPVIPMSARGGFDVRAIRALRRIIREQAIDVVHAHTSHAHGLGMWACLGIKTPLLVTRRVDFAVHGVIRRWKYRQATRVVAVSAAVQNVLIAGKVPAERIEVIHDGIDFSRLVATDLKSVRQEFGIDANAMVFGITAHLTDHKDHRTLLNAFAHLEKKLPNAWLLIAGVGELESELKSQASALALSHVRFLGYRNDVAQVLSACNAFVLSSHHEGLGSSLMDAMYLGLPVIATCAGGVPELITDNVDGLLVPVRDPTTLSAAMLRIANDPALRERLGTRARETARARFSATRMVADYERVYARLLEHAA